MHKCLVVSFVVALLCSCKSPVQGVIRLRATSGDSSAHAVQVKLLEEFVGKRQAAVWRAEAMTTMLQLDTNYEHRTYHPSTHQRLIQALKDEHKSPRAARPNSYERRHLRAWSLYTLSKVEEHDSFDLFLHTFETQQLRSDPQLKIILAAGNGILNSPKRRMPNNGRQRILERCAYLKGRLQRWPSSYDKRIWAMIEALENQLLTYRDVVDMLPENENLRVNSTQLLEIMQWNYQMLRIGEHKSVENNWYRENLKRLLILAHHHDSSVLNRAREILILMEPQVLLKNLSEVISKKLAEQQDFEHAVQAIARLQKNPKKVSNSTAFIRQCKVVVDGIVQAHPRHSLKNREYLYGRLFDVAPKPLTTGLIRLNMKAQKENLQKQLQHLRYLAHLSRTPKVQGTVLEEQLYGAIAEWSQVENTEIRKLVVGELLHKRPALLLLSHGQLIKQSLDAKRLDFAYLLDSYIAALIEAEKTKKDVLTRANLDPLAKACMRPEYLMKGKVAKYLQPREPAALTSMIYSAVKEELPENRDDRLRAYALLADLSRKHGKLLTPGTRRRILAVLQAGLSATDEEEGLLLTRAIYELGGDVPAKTLAKMPHSVRLLAELAAEKGGAK